jgi:hypothetical protein
MKTPSLIEDGHTLDIVPRWRRWLQKLLPFKRRKVVALEDVLPLLDAMEFTLFLHNTDPEMCVDKLSAAYTKFIFKHPLP